jgi:alkanesulfonate monooxygenase SsuD/methylene tetrahydromethanopterin reductase-like flavin-dependent oxidoreductase (luciferase family)
LELEMPIDFGLALPPSPPKDNYSKWLTDIEATVRLFQDDFRSLWSFDHFSTDDNPVYEAWTVMSFLAAHFPTYEIGSLVLAHGYRNPALVALMATTLQTLSQGRFIMGIGAGWKEDDYLNYKYEFPRAGIRIEQLEDTLNIFKKLWTEPGPVSYAGKHYQIADAWCEPKPDPMIPIMVGGPGKKTMRLAAQYADIWNTFGSDVQVYTELVNILRQHCDDLGREMSTLRLSALCRMFIAKTQVEAEQKAAEAGIDNALIGTPDKIAEEMAKFIEIGVDYFMLYIHGLHEPDVAGLITEELMPRIKAL